ncbi:hypothetical protein [Klebsiella quasipneumoniae]|uniref:hypothetical protein n=1 Tax=Klebsiella quasipneumoniae TaxID=1463165 RepID=UPI00352ABAC5
MSESLKDVVSSVKDAIITPVQEAFVYRAKNPFFGSLIISWVYWNWNKIAYMLLSDDDVLKKIEFIKKSIPDNTLIPFTSFSIPHTHSLWFPLFFSIFFTLSYPVFSWVLTLIHKGISFRIEKVDSEKEVKRLQLQGAIITEFEKNEGLRAVERSKTEETKFSTAERAAESKYNIRELQTQHATLKTEVAQLEKQKQSMETILSEQEKRRKGVVEEITLLQEKVAPERESVQRIERIINRNIELENLLTTKESLINSKLDETNQKYAFYFSNMVMLDMYKVECENYRKIFKELEEKTTQIFSYVESDDPTRGRSNEGYFMLKSDIKELVSKGLDHEQKFRNSH